jgi:hypothetical protein
MCAYFPPQYIRGLIIGAINDATAMSATPMLLPPRKGVLLFKNHRIQLLHGGFELRAAFGYGSGWWGRMVLITGSFNNVLRRAHQSTPHSQPVWKVNSWFQMLSLRGSRM